jgi:hypothetical protein
MTANFLFSSAFTLITIRIGGTRIATSAMTSVIWREVSVVLIIELDLGRRSATPFQVYQRSQKHRHSLNTPIHMV